MHKIQSRLVLLSAMGLLIASCQQHSSAYDDAWAQCEASAIEALETEDPQQGQASSDREEAIRACMAEKGFSD
jgi:hypothetical protein